MGWSFNPFGFQKNLALMQNLVTSYAEELLMILFSNTALCKLWKSFRNKWCLYTMTCYPFSNWQSAREIRPLCLFSQSFISRGSKPSYPFRARRAVAHSFVLDKENLLSQTCISGFFFRLKMMAIFKVFVLVMVSYMIGVQNETKIHHRVKKNVS